MQIKKLQLFLLLSRYLLTESSILQQWIIKNQNSKLHKNTCSLYIFFTI
ncbi:MAG: hypothetical protein RLZZ293_958 [Pseudomonadota bacterium]|jgi:hypothetical protein